MSRKPWYQADEDDDLELAERKRVYRSQTGDAHWRVGYEARFAAWFRRAAVDRDVSRA
jgi:hypothetical protein